MKNRDIVTLPLPENQIDLWFIFLPDHYSLIDKMLDFLSKKEIHRMNEYFFREDQIKFAICRYHLKDIVGKYLSKKRQDIVVDYQQYSKPFLSSECDSPIKFNISHSGDIVVYSFSSYYEIGVDIEKYNAKIDVVGLSQKYFSKEENDIIAESNQSTKLSLFYNIWTNKEAYLKYNGMGLNIPIHSFSLHQLEENLLSFLPIYQKIDGNHIQYFLALCTPYTIPRIQIKHRPSCLWF